MPGIPGADDPPRRAARILGRAAEELCFGFGLPETLFVAVVVVMGARYVPAGPPILLALFLGLSHLARPGRPRRNRAFVHVVCFATGFLAASALAAALAPPASGTQVLARVMHQAMAVVAVLAASLWLHRHVRAPVPAGPASGAVRTSGRLAWVLFKVSLWSGTVVALLVILESWVRVHVLFLALSLPPVVAHVWIAKRARGRDRLEPGAEEVRLAPPGLGRILASSGVAGAAASAALILGLPGWPSENIVRPRAELVTSRDADFGHTAARTASGDGFAPPVLAQSATCGNPSCHPFLFADWRSSAHRSTASLAYRDLVERVAADRGRRAAGACMACHDPISLAGGAIGANGELLTAEGRREGLSCLACHSTRVPDGERGNPGSWVLTLPPLFSSVPWDPRSALTLTPEHRVELGFVGDDADALCESCHRPPRLTEVPLSLVAVLDALHEADGMVDACRAPTPCTACHMQRVTRNARPGQPAAPSHGFVAPPLPPRREAEAERSTADGGATG